MDIKNKFGLSDFQAEQFEKYTSLLIEWNEKFNLTSIIEPDEITVKHYADSLLGAEYIKNDAAVLDIGAGAGFPSLPIKIVRPDISVTLCDSVNKKIIFLIEVIKELKLNAVTALHIRAEELDKKVKYDVGVSRAVARLNVLSEYVLPFIKLGGIFIAYKADGAEEEVKEAEEAIKILGGKIVKNQRILLDGDIYRRIIVIEKIKETPKEYPRKKNLPRLNPILKRQ